MEIPARNDDANLPKAYRQRIIRRLESSDKDSSANLDTPGSALPANVPTIVWLYAHTALALDLLEAVALQFIPLIRGGGEAHRTDVMRAGVGGSGVGTRLPDARR